VSDVDFDWVPLVVVVVGSLGDSRDVGVDAFPVCPILPYCVLPAPVPVFYRISTQNRISTSSTKDIMTQVAILDLPMMTCGLSWTISVSVSYICICLISNINLISRINVV